MHVSFSHFLKPKRIALIWEIGDEVTEYMVDLFLLEASSNLSQQVPLPLEVYSLT